MGNTLTTLLTVPQKLRGGIKERYRLMSLGWAIKMRKKIRGKAERKRISESRSEDDPSIEEDDKTK